MQGFNSISAYPMVDLGDKDIQATSNLMYDIVMLDQMCAIDWLVLPPGKFML